MLGPDLEMVQISTGRIAPRRLPSATGQNEEAVAARRVSYAWAISSCVLVTLLATP